MLHKGIEFPDWDIDFPKWLDEYPEVNGKPTYQFRKLAECLSWIPETGVAIDVGAHVGLWAMHLADYFDGVRAYEPVEEYRECFAKNTKGCELRGVGCSDKHEFVKFDHHEGFSGCTWVDGPGEIELVRIDDDSPPENITFMKFDCEGYEYFAIVGAESTIKKWKPCIIVEQKPGNAQKYGLQETQAVDLLRGWGATLRKVDCGDYILSWD